MRTTSARDAHAQYRAQTESEIDRAGAVRRQRLARRLDDWTHEPCRGEIGVLASNPDATLEEGLKV
jgi:hypothetical protein